MKEGVIKFSYKLNKTGPLVEQDYLEIEKWRAILYRLKFIGEYLSEELGYGNISKRCSQNSDQFVITGTQTGRFPNLRGEHYTKITHSDLDKMKLEAHGPIAPSSESLTHFAIYSTCPQINYIFHIHHEEMWNYMIKNNLDATQSDVDYGTKEMALAAGTLIGNKNAGIFVMKGHQDGIISYGNTAQEAGQLILEMSKKFHHTDG